MYDFFSDFFNGFEIIPSITYTRSNDLVCPMCKHTYYDFQKTGRLGCTKCYETFKAPLSSVINQIHSNSTHVGKIPSQCEGNLKLKRKYESIKAQLQEAVKNENYEEAAKLHREMKAIEGEVK